MDRYTITSEEKKTILSTYINKEGQLKEMPSKEKRKLVILEEVMKHFEKEKEYSEKEVNDILKTIYSDYPYLRRLLIEYKFLQRTADGRIYWLK